MNIQGATLDAQPVPQSITDQADARVAAEQARLLLLLLDDML